MEYVLLVVGFVLLIKGADFFVEGSSSLAQILKVPSVVIGLTIVAMGTSAPEASVSINAALAGSNDIAISNVVGSNIFNGLVVVGVCAFLSAFKTNRDILKRDMPLNILVTFILCLMFLDGKLNRIEGGILFAGMILYITVMIYHAIKNKSENEPEKILSLPRSIIYMIAGLAAVIFGGDLVVDKACIIATNFGVSQNFIGLTIVAFGTSAPELTVSVSSALKGSADIAIGNVVGSNIFNTLMIVGCTALFAPIVITRNTLRKEIPLCILSSIVLLICANDVFLDKAPENILNRVDGLLLLCFFVIFMGYTFAIASKPGTTEQAGQIEAPTIEEETEIKSLPWWKSILYIIGGLAALIFGGQLFVDGATGIARNLGVSESIIGLTLVAGGTSLPELATSIVAALKKNPEIAIGNVIGSNLFNIFFVLGCSASITPLHLSGITNFDLFTLVGSGILLWLFGLFFAKRTITRIEGGIMILCYVAYTVVLIYNT